ncbi:hypothetical protein GCM10029992_12460 [Glycomyces albus]
MSEHRQPGGRPRDGRIDGAIAQATRELLAERGYAGLTVDAVAARAGVGKAAIYRRHATKQEMIFAATVHDMQEQPPPDAGSLRGTWRRSPAPSPRSCRPPRPTSSTACCPTSTPTPPSERASPRPSSNANAS